MKVRYFLSPYTAQEIKVAFTQELKEVSNVRMLSNWLLRRHF
jgi:hypothetical protein